MLDVLHCSSEVVPFSKTGGLADVSSALPQALTRLGHDVTIVTPLYASVDREKVGARDTGRTFEVTLGGRTERFGVFEAALPAGTRVFLLANDGFFGRDQLYGTRDGDYADNHLRFAFLSAALFRLLRTVRLRPDIIHCHDWQTGLVPAYNRVFHLDMFATVITIHNMAYQGVFPADVLPEVNLPWDLFNPEQVEFYGNVNFLKAGMVFADRVTTVSPRYAREVTTPEFGCGLDGVLRRRAGDFAGILNGADYAEWSPATDPTLPARYSAGDISGKSTCRDALLREFGVAAGDMPVFGVVGRLTSQKGYDLLAEVLGDLVDAGAAVAILGTGDAVVEDMLRAAAALHPGAVGLRVAYDDRLAHLVEAGSDFFLLPSRYEPCGLNQVYSMAYGTLPVVHAVGGLDDTVVDVDEDPANATGLKFREFGRDAFLACLRRAICLWKDRPAFEEVRLRGMARDFSWAASARAYTELYASAIR